MKRIYDWFVNLAKDKLLHIILIAAITAVAIMVFKLYGCGRNSCAYGWAVGAVCGIVKEIIDELKKKNSEASDWAADLVSASVVSLYSLVVMI